MHHLVLRLQSPIPIDSVVVDLCFYMGYDHLLLLAVPLLEFVWCSYMLFKCYRAYISDYPAESLDPILYYIQRKDCGWMSVGIGSVDFYMSDRDWSLWLLQYPRLERRVSLDYLG